MAVTLGFVFPGGWGSDPLQTIGALFKFRDRIAHGRSERLSPKPKTVKWNGDIEDYFNTRPATEWEKHLVDDQFVRRAREQVEVALERLHERRTDEKEALFIMGMTIGSASLA